MLGAAGDIVSAAANKDRSDICVTVPAFLFSIVVAFLYCTVHVFACLFAPLAISPLKFCPEGHEECQSDTYSSMNTRL